MNKTQSIRTVGKKSFAENIREYKYPYLMLLPSLILVFMFSYIPMIGIVMAFKDYDMMKGIMGSQWVGMKHFKEIFTNADMIKSIWNTLWYGIVLSFGTFPFPILLAILINEIGNARFKKTVQTISYLPYFLSMITVVGIFYSVFSMEGTINSIIGKFAGADFTPKNYLYEDKYFLPILFVVSIWKNVGWSSVLFLAAIAGIDQTLYEAAYIDGCGKLKQVFYITLPGIASTVMIVLIMNLATILNVSFEMVYGFQNVYVQEKTEVISTIIYRWGIQNGEYSKATAFGLAQGLVSIILLVGGNTFAKKTFDISIW